MFFQGGLLVEVPCLDADAGERAHADLVSGEVSRRALADDTSGTFFHACREGQAGGGAAGIGLKA